MSPTSTNVVQPTPFPFKSSQSWDGDDGSWSSFIVQVGTPPQSFRVLPSTAGLSVLVPVAEGCTTSDPTNCSSTRGVISIDGKSKGFVAAQSSSWIAAGLFTSSLESRLGYKVNGLYGFDTIVLGGNESQKVSLTRQSMAGIAAKDFYLGLFGLALGTIEFGGSSSPQSSYLGQLASAGVIPSRAYGYTAGASYTNTSGSLTLGGYDSSRFTPSNITIPLGKNSTLIAPLQSILGQNTFNSTSAFLSSSINVTIDSTLPYLWLPAPTCDFIASAFGLIYDNTTDLYLTNLTLRTQLLARSPTITFVFGTAGSETQSITLPYSALDLQVTYPLYESSTRYFPLRRANNESQYTLGRAFLQEAYIITDYERQSMTLAAATRTSSGVENIVPIYTITPQKPPSQRDGLGKGGIAGIVAAAVIALLVVCGAYVIYRRRRRGRAGRRILATNDATHEHADGGKENEEEEELHEVSGASRLLPEADGSTAKWGKSGVQELEHVPRIWEVELQADDGAVEICESREIIHELQGSEVVKKE